MAERVARAVGDGPRRRLGFGTGAVAMIAAAVMILGGAFASAPAARTVNKQTRAASAGATRTPAGQSGQTGLTRAQINTDVDSLISKMTVAEKIGHRFAYYHPGLFNGIFSLAMVGAMLPAWLLGYLADSWGVGVVMLLPMAGTCMVFVLVLLIWLDSKLGG